MRDFVPIIEEFTDTDVQTLALLMDAPEVASGWRGIRERSTSEKAALAEELSNRIAQLVPRQHRSRHPLPIHYGHLLEIAADLLGIDASFAAVPNLDVLGRQVASRVARGILKHAPVDEVDRFMQELDAESRKLGARLDATEAGRCVSEALELDPIDGPSTYVLASSLTATSANALGISMPYMAYTALSSSLAALLGPAGWAAAGIAGLAGLRAARSRIAARQRLRFLAVVTYLLAVEQRVRAHIEQEDAAAPGSDEAIEQLERDVEEMWSLVESLESEVGDKRLQADALEARNGVLEGKIAELEQQVEMARERQGYRYPTEPGRTVPLSTHGNHVSIWNHAVRSIDDVPQPDRRLFLKLMEHVGVQRIQLGNYNGASPQPRRPPVLMLRQQGDGQLVGRLYTRARRKNCCDLTVVVERGSESSVLHYAAEEGLLRGRSQG